MAYYPGMEGRRAQSLGYGPGSLYSASGDSKVTGRPRSVEDEKNKYHYGRNRPGAAWDRSSTVVGGPGSYMAGAIPSPHAQQGYMIPSGMTAQHPMLAAASNRRAMMMRWQQVATDPILQRMRELQIMKNMGLLPNVAGHAIPDEVMDEAVG